MITSRSSRFMIIFLSAFILADVIPSESMAIRFGLPELVGAVVGSHPSITRRFVGTAPRERAKSPGRRGSKPRVSSEEQKDNFSQPVFKTPEIPKLLSQEERRALIQTCEENCAPTLARLDATESLRGSPYKLGPAAKAILELGRLLRDEEDEMERLGRDRLYRERVIDVVGMWREGIHRSSGILDSFDPLSQERMSLERIDRLIRDTFAATKIPYESPLEKYLKKS